jgi:hypothetical protein
LIIDLRRIPTTTAAASICAAHPSHRARRAAYPTISSRISTASSCHGFYYR